MYTENSDLETGLAETGQASNRSQHCIHQRQNQQPITDEKIKQIIMDTLIELRFVPQPQKKKILSNV